MEETITRLAALEARVDELQARVDQLEPRVAALEPQVKSLEARTGELEESLAPFVNASRSQRERAERIAAQQLHDDEVAEKAGAP